MGMKGLRDKSKIAKFIPVDEWVTTARVTDLMNAGGVNILPRTVAHTLRLACKYRAGIQRRGNTYDAEEWRVHDPMSFAAFFRDLVNRR